VLPWRAKMATVMTRRWRPWRREYVVFAPVPPLVRGQLDDRPRTFSETHARLLRELRSAPGEEWSRVALRSCLEHLAVSWTTEAWAVEVEDAWTEDRWTFCVVYRYPYIDGRLGLRSTALDPSLAGRLETFYGDERPDQPDPVRFGQNVADFDIGEPLGTVADHLHPSADGINWWSAAEHE
jgi:hypothetical protein